MPSCVPLCSKYAHIKFCIDCSIRESNAPMTVLLGYFNIILWWLSYWSISILNHSFLHNVAVYVIFFITAFHTIPFWIIQNRQGFSFSDNQSTKLCLICWHYAQYFSYLLCPKLGWHIWCRPTHCHGPWQDIRQFIIRLFH